MRRVKVKGHELRYGELERVPSTHKSAIVIIPPQNCWRQIQDIRCEHDKAYERWMPHINLIYPYLEDVTSHGSKGVFHTESQKILKHLGAVSPFRVAFTKDSIGQFVHGRTATIWLKPLKPPGGEQKVNRAAKKPSQSPHKKKKIKITQKMVKKQVSKPAVYHIPQVSSAGIVEVTGYPLPISGSMKQYESSLDKLARAEWKAGTSDRIPLKEILQYGPGLDCLRYAEWTPENTKQPMFTHTVHKTQMYITEGTRPTNTQTYETEEQYEYVDVEVTDSEDEEELDSEEEYVQVSYNRSASNSEFYSDPTASHPGVIEVQAKLQEMYPSLNELSTKSPDGFQPHLTLGQDTGGRLLENIKSTWRPLEFDVKEIHLISRENDRTPFKIKQTIPLGAMAHPDEWL